MTALQLHGKGLSKFDCWTDQQSTRGYQVSPENTQILLLKHADKDGSDENAIGPVTTAQPNVSKRLKRRLNDIFYAHKTFQPG